MDTPTRLSLALRERWGPSGLNDQRVPSIKTATTYAMIETKSGRYQPNNPATRTEIHMHANKGPVNGPKLSIQLMVHPSPLPARKLPDGEKPIARTSSANAHRAARSNADR